MNTPQLTLSLLEDNFAVCKLPVDADVSSWMNDGALSSITRTADELSIVCSEKAVPSDVQSEKGWRAFKVDGQLDFGLTGILVAIAKPLADVRISIFALSTFNTDYVLVKNDKVQEAITVLQNAGHSVRESVS